MDISTIPGLNKVIAGSLATVNVTDEVALAKLNDDQLLVIPGMSPQRLAKIRATIGYGADEAQENLIEEDGETVDSEGIVVEVVEETERELVKFEWPNYPQGTMALHSGLGYPGEKDVRFFAGFHMTDDPDVIAALRERGRRFNDVFEVPLGATDRTHKASRKAPPPIPTA